MGRPNGLHTLVLDVGATKTAVGAASADGDGRELELSVRYRTADWPSLADLVRDYREAWRRLQALHNPYSVKR